MEAQGQKYAVKRYLYGTEYVTEYGTELRYGVLIQSTLQSTPDGTESSHCRHLPANLARLLLLIPSPTRRATRNKPFSFWPPTLLLNAKLQYIAAKQANPRSRDGACERVVRYLVRHLRVSIEHVNT